MTLDEIHALEQRMDELAHEYGTTHDREILAELKELSRQVRELENILAVRRRNKNSGVPDEPGLIDGSMRLEQVTARATPFCIGHR